MSMAGFLPYNEKYTPVSFQYKDKYHSPMLISNIDLRPVGHFILARCADELPRRYVLRLIIGISKMPYFQCHNNMSYRDDIMLICVSLDLYCHIV